jgi:hypothetical protein
VRRRASSGGGRVAKLGLLIGPRAQAGA